MSYGVKTTIIFKLDNYFLMTSMYTTSVVMFNSESSIGGLFSLVDTYIQLKETIRVPMKQYRKSLEKLIGRTFIIEAKVSCRSKKVIKPDKITYVLNTLCLEDIKCAIRKDDKLKVVAKVGHAWLSEDSSKIVTKRSIKPGQTIRLYCKVSEYTYANGMEQLGLIQDNSKPFKIME